MLLSFPADVGTDVLVAPLLYGVIVVPFSLALALGFRQMRRAPSADEGGGACDYC